MKDSLLIWFVILGLIAMQVGSSFINNKQENEIKEIQLDLAEMN